MADLIHELLLHSAERRPSADALLYQANVVDYGSLARLVHG
jgi:hypothetical protein